MTRLLGLWRVGDKQRPLLDRSHEYVGQLDDGVVLDDALGDRFADHLLDHGDTALPLDGAHRLPSEHDRSVEQHDTLNFRFDGCLQEALQAAAQPFPRIRTLGWRRQRPQGEVAFHFLEHRPKQFGLVAEVVIERPAGPHPGFGYEIPDAGVEIAVGNEQGATCVDQIASSLVAALTPLVVGSAPLRHADIVTTFMLYVAKMADDEVRAYGSVAPLKVGLLNDYPTMGDTDNDTVNAIKLVIDEALAAARIDRPVELVRRNVVGLPNGTYAAVERAFDELVGEGCLAIFGPWISDNVVPLRPHVDETARTPIITLSGSEGALGEWCFALNNGSMAEEPVMLAAVMLGDNRSRIAIAYEASLIGKEYLSFAEKAYTAAGLTVVATMAIPQVEADKADVVDRLRATEPDALVHVGFGHGLWGFTDALLAAGWDPPRYTTTAFEMAHINAEWMRQLAGWIGLDSYDERNAVGQAFLDRFEARYGRRPGHSMPGLARDAATVIVRALAGARPLTGGGVKRAMEQVKLIPAASGAPGTFLRFGRFIRQGWLGSDYSVARRVLPDGSGHVFHAVPSENISRAVGVG